MSEDILNLNFEGAAEYKVAEPGQYEMTVQTATYKKPAEAGKFPQIILSCSFDDPEVGSPIRHSLVIHPNPVSKAVLRSTISALLNVDLSDADSFELDLEDLPGCSFIGQIEHESYFDKNGNARIAAKIKRFYPLNKNAPSSPVSTVTDDEETF